MLLTARARARVLAQSNMSLDYWRGTAQRLIRINSSLSFELVRLRLSIWNYVSSFFEVIHLRPVNGN